MTKKEEKDQDSNLSKVNEKDTEHVNVTSEVQVDNESKRQKTSDNEEDKNIKTESETIKEKKDHKATDKKKTHVKKIKTEISPEIMSLFPKRCANVAKFVGAHVSISGGIHNSIKSGLSIG